MFVNKEWFLLIFIENSSEIYFVTKYYSLRGEKVKKNSKNTIVLIFGSFMAVFTISMLILLIYKILFVESTDKATILGGVLSFLGGVTGATAAYFIARMQMTEQIELQFNKEKHKMNLEIEIANLQSAIHLLAKIRTNVMKTDGFRSDFVKEYLRATQYKTAVSRDNFNQTFNSGKELLRELLDNCSQYIVYKFVYNEGEKFDSFYNDLVKNINTFVLWYQAPIDNKKIVNIKDTEMFQILLKNIEAEIADMQGRIKNRMNDYEEY
ncbi:hypothetical protein [Viridibacillus arvi]|uniref:hypothetical protein n=1 Tax=Viridibacillus arvi TaxID=263475 RepID=UPI003D04F997